MSSSSQADFVRRCRAAEELSTLGFHDESGVLWRTAFAGLSTLEPTLAESVRSLLADAPTDAHAHSDWQRRARELADRCADRSQLQVRWPIAVASAIFACTLLTFLVHLGRPVVVSSANFSEMFPASLAVDGDETTEWLLPEQAVGFIELTLSRRSAIHAVTVTNGHNREYNDRAVHTARVAVYDDDLEVDSVPLSFDKISAEPTRRVAKLAGKQGTRVRIYVEEFFGSGAAVAEVELD